MGDHNGSETGGGFGANFPGESTFTGGFTNTFNYGDAFVGAGNSHVGAPTQEFNPFGSAQPFSERRPSFHVESGPEVIMETYPTAEHSDGEGSDLTSQIEYDEELTDISSTMGNVQDSDQAVSSQSFPSLAYPYLKTVKEDIVELEQYPTIMDGEVGSKLKEDPTAPKLPWYWKIYYAFFPSTQKEIRPWCFGVLMDIIFLLLIVFFLTTLYYDEPDKIREAWFFPFLGIFAAIISTSTPAGGGVIFFPFMVLIDVKPLEAAAFSMTTQAFSMGVFGAGQWIRKAPPGLIVYWMVFVVVAASWGGVIISMLLIPITNGGALEAFFLIFVIILAIYVLYGLIKGDLQTQNQKVKKNLVNVVVLLCLGLAGGMLVGYIAVGIDIMFFILMSLFYKANSNMATVDSILIMGWSCWLPAFLNLVAFDNLRFNFVLMTLIGSVLGARIGPALNILLGRKNVLIAFEVLLTIEILRAIAYLFLAPLIFSGSEFFWAGDYSDDS